MKRRISLIEDEWLSLVGYAYGKKLNPTSIQYKELKKMFYAGYCSMYHALEIAYNLNANEITNVLNIIERELEEYASSGEVRGTNGRGQA